MVRETAGNTGSGKDLSDSNVFEILTSTAPSSESRKDRPLPKHRAEVHPVSVAPYRGQRTTNTKWRTSPKYSGTAKVGLSPASSKRVDNRVCIAVTPRQWFLTTTAPKLVRGLAGRSMGERQGTVIWKLGGSKGLVGND